MKTFYHISHSLFTLLLVIIIAFSAEAQTVRRVVASPAGATQDGTSWANAMSLQAALTVSVAEDAIWVAGGMYTPSKLQDGSDPSAGDERDVTFAIPDGVSIYGGFAGTESNLSERNITLIGSTNKTTLSGERGDMGVNTDNVRGIVRIDGPSSGSAVGSSLNGLTISGGYGGAVGAFGGAGIFAPSDAILNISHCLFENNTGVSSGFFTPGNGGAIYMFKGAIANTRFTGNSSPGHGGALYKGAGTGDLTITECIFMSNTVGGTRSDGGAVYLGGGMSTLSNSMFISNMAGDDGGAIYANGGTN